MTCREAGSLVDLLYEELAAEERSRLAAHIDECPECGERWAHLRALAATADRWTAPPPPRGIAERALARLASERAREVERRWADISPEQVAKCVGFGAAAALVALLLVLGVAERQVTPLTIGIAGVVWTVLFVGAFLARCDTRLRRIAVPALAGAGVTLILAPPLSIPAMVELCARLIQAAPESVSFALVLALVAAGYTAAPLFLGSLVFGRSAGARPVADGATLSVLYALLIAPAVYLQCLALPLNVTAVWMAGGIVGAALAGPVSLGLAGRRTRAA